ncbi:MAG: hypothetical protein A3H69_05575 [Candidatus Sungbacteria bacterium RIFCSPLOWO2_02_FULL_47_9]|nr:MAG: hypothetical protein A3H69_05575 [Candidatus Sungbacteria bacterium RIFCSPLOWO2_02_FULL_47_9]
MNMNKIFFLVLAGSVLFIAPAAHAEAKTIPSDSWQIQAVQEAQASPDCAPNLPDFTKKPFFLAVDHIVFPSRIHPEWGLIPWAIFITDEAKRNFIGIYYNDTSVVYAEWVTDSKDGVVVRGYWYIGDVFVFEKEIPRPAEEGSGKPPKSDKSI